MRTACEVPKGTLLYGCHNFQADCTLGLYMSLTALLLVLKYTMVAGSGASVASARDLALGRVWFTYALMEKPAGRVKLLKGRVGSVCWAAAGYHRHNRATNATQIFMLAQSSRFVQYHGRLWVILRALYPVYQYIA